MPTDWCPFDPGSGRVPDNYDVYIYPNDFPAFSIPPPEPAIEGDDFYRVDRSHEAAIPRDAHRNKLYLRPVTT